MKRTPHSSLLFAFIVWDNQDSPGTPETFCPHHKNSSMKKLLLAIWEDLFHLVLSTSLFLGLIALISTHRERTTIIQGHEIVIRDTEPVSMGLWIWLLLSGLMSVYFFIRCTMKWWEYLTPTQPTSLPKNK